MIAFRKDGRRISLKQPSKWALIGAFLAIVLLSLSPSIGSKIRYDGPQTNQEQQKLMIHIYREVLELGSPYEECLKREFWIDLDKDAGNKEEHVVILKRQKGGQDQVLLQIT